nr:immunoglobulin heavy chain junction region [Mus musculus]MBK4186675.1 immunoglobulin heavy chain junction region [Mus musculus]
CTRWDYDVGYW